MLQNSDNTASPRRVGLLGGFSLALPGFSGARQPAEFGDPGESRVWYDFCSAIVSAKNQQDLLEMPASYEKLGIRFQFPDNWTLDETEAQASGQEVTVYSPGGAFWSITIHPADVAPQELADAALKAMQAEYDELDAEAIEETVADLPLIGWDMNFYCLDLTNTAQVRAFRTPQASYLVFCQADDREFDEVAGIFRAITFSLLS